MKAKITRYEVVCDEPGAQFEPCGIMTSNKQNALRELHNTRKRYPEAYLAKVTYAREPETKSRPAGPVSVQ